MNDPATEKPRSPAAAASPRKPRASGPRSFSLFEAVALSAAAVLLVVGGLILAVSALRPVHPKAMDAGPLASSRDPARVPLPADRSKSSREPDGTERVEATESGGAKAEGRSPSGSQPSSPRPSPPAAPAKDAGSVKPDGTQPGDGKLPDSKPKVAEPRKAKTAEEKPTEQPKSPPSSDEKFLVTEFAPLPDPETSSPDASSRLVRVSTQETAAEKYSLTLHGLDFANEQLPDPARLETSIRSKGSEAKDLVVCLTGSAAAEKAKFSLVGSDITFQWLGSSSEEEKKCLKWLAACVLEVQGGREPRYIALTRQIRLPKLALETREGHLLGEIRFDEEGGVAGKVPSPVRDFPFSLGRGKVHFDGEKTAAFGRGQGTAPPYTGADWHPASAWRRFLSDGVA